MTSYEIDLEKLNIQYIYINIYSLRNGIIPFPDSLYWWESCGSRTPGNFPIHMMTLDLQKFVRIYF